jgi:hypothetical protein
MQLFNLPFILVGVKWNVGSHERPRQKEKHAYIKRAIGICISCFYY